MPQSLANIYSHLIFSTKKREAYLNDDVRPTYTAIWRRFWRT